MQENREAGEAELLFLEDGLLTHPPPVSRQGEDFPHLLLASHHCATQREMVLGGACWCVVVLAELQAAARPSRVPSAPADGIMLW